MLNHPGREIGSGLDRLAWMFGEVLQQIGRRLPYSARRVDRLCMMHSKATISAFREELKRSSQLEARLQVTLAEVRAANAKIEERFHRAMDERSAGIEKLDQLPRLSDAAMSAAATAATALAVAEATKAELGRVRYLLEEMIAVNVKTIAVELEATRECVGAAISAAVEKKDLETERSLYDVASRIRVLEEKLL